MRKAIFCIEACLLALLLCGCAGTKTALIVGKNEIDEAEYAFYLNYNRYSGSEPSSAEEMDKVRENAVKQIVTNEVVRIKCRELGPFLSKEQRESLKAEKKEFVELLGGKAEYLKYLKESYMTDRLYDKIAENELYFNMLFEYITAENEYTEEELRRFFAENYIGVKYIFFSTTDDEGEPLPQDETEKIKLKAEEVLAKALEPGSDFDDLIDEYGDDTLGGESMIVSRLDASGQSYLEGAFELNDNEAGGVFSDETGLYVVKRVPAEASYYEENRAYINETAANMNFNEQLEEWSSQTKVTVKRSVKRINFDNLKKFVR